MKKRKLLFAAAMLFFSAGAWAQTDVTSTYITNPSFEKDGLMSAGNGTNPQMITPTGWTQEQNASGSFQDNKICNASTSNGSNYGTTVTPSDGEYYLFYRHGWNGSNYAKFTTSPEVSLPQGFYTLKVDYKMVSGSDNTNNNDNTSISLSAISGETTLGTTTAKSAVQINNNGTTAVLKNNDWITLETPFLVESETNTQFVINLLACGPKRSDFVVDNVRLFYTELVNPTEITLNNSSLSLTTGSTSTLSVTYNPANANYNTDITWTSSDETIASVSSAGVVTALKAGSATITATTANSKFATCSVTVADAAAPSYYSSIEEGDFYILNAATGKFLGGGNSWGTQASLIDHGIPFTIAETDGNYTLDSHTYNSESQHFLTGTYVDGAATSLYITSIVDGKYSISTTDGSDYLTATAGSTIVANTADNSTSTLAQWYFVSKDDLEKALLSATNAAPIDATFYIGDPNFSRNHILSTLQNGKTTVNPGNETYPWNYTASNYNFKGGNNVNMCAETYRNNGGTITQTLTVPNGKYIVKCQGFYRLDEGSDKSYLTANDKKAELNIFNANDEGTAPSMSGASTSFSEGLYQNELEVYVVDGTLTIGIQNADGNWCCFDNFELYYHGFTFNGTYFVRSSDGKYIARGADYNTRATVDEFGLPLMVTTDADGNTTFKYVDNNLYLFDAGNTNIYTDNTSNPNWKLQATEGGFYIVNANDNGSKDKTVGIVDGHLQSNDENVVWNFEALSAHNTFMEALKDAQAATAATASGNETIKTKAELATWLDNNYNAVPIDVPAVGFTDKWNGNASAEWGAGKDMYTNTISSLPEGLYKLTVNAYYRLNGSASAADGARGNTYLYGGSVKTQLYSVHDFPAVEPWVVGNDQSDDFGYYPNNVDGGAAALNAGNYLNELYVYHTGGDFTYGIHQPSRFSNSQWFGFQNFTLTRYEIEINEDADYSPVSAKGYVRLTRTIKGEGTWNTFVVPFDITNEELKAAFGNDVAVAEFSDAGESASAVTINFNTMATPAITANTPVLLKGNAGTEFTFTGKLIKAGEAKVDGNYVDFVGAYNASTTIASGDYYIGSNMLYKSNGSATIKGTRAYLHAKSAGVKAINFFVDEDDATGISLTPALSEGEEAIYNVAGQRMSKVQKGINIVNGKKVLF